MGDKYVSKWTAVIGSAVGTIVSVLTLVYLLGGSQTAIAKDIEAINDKLIKIQKGIDDNTIKIAIDPKPVTHSRLTEHDRRLVRLESTYDTILVVLRQIAEQTKGK